MNLTVFFGTFNPVHIAHLIIAETVRDEFNSDKILFIPAYCPPHRNESLAEPLHRLNMVNLAIKNNNFFESSDIEFSIKDRSYSYITILKLLEKTPNITGMSEVLGPDRQSRIFPKTSLPLRTGKINFIIGSDAFNLIDTWYEAENLSKLVTFILVARPDSPDIKEILNNIQLKCIDYRIINAPESDISSSYIRSRIKQNKSIRYLVPELVEEYIYDNKLYLS